MKKVCVVGGRNPNPKGIAPIALILAEVVLVPDMEGIVILVTKPSANVANVTVPVIPVAHGPVNVTVKPVSPFEPVEPPGPVIPCCPCKPVIPCCPVAP